MVTILITVAAHKSFSTQIEYILSEVPGEYALYPASGVPAEIGRLKIGERTEINQQIPKYDPTDRYVAFKIIFDQPQTIIINDHRQDKIAGIKQIRLVEIPTPTDYAAYSQEYFDLWGVYLTDEKEDVSEHDWDWKQGDYCWRGPISQLTSKSTIQIIIRKPLEHAMEKQTEINIDFQR